MSTSLGVHISWTGKPGDTYAQYSDLTPWATAIDTQRGRSTELDAIQTGTASIVLDNSDGRFSPGRAYGKELLPDNVRTSTATTGTTNGFSSSAHASLASVTSPTLLSSAALQATVTSAVTAAERIVITATTPVTPGTAYRGAVLAQQTSSNPWQVGGPSAQCYIRFFDGAGYDLGTGADVDPAWRQYSDVIRASVPIAHYRMNDATLTDKAAPAVGTDPMVCYNITAGAAGSSWSQGGTGTSAVFNGTSSIADPCGLPLLSSFGVPTTVEMWFKPTGPGALLGDGGQSGQPVSNTGTPTAGVIWPVAYIGTDGYLYAQASSSSLAGRIKSTFQVNDGSWHHLVIASTGISVYYFLDGLQFGTDPQCYNITRPVIGYGDLSMTGTMPNKPSSKWFAGQVADVALYRHQLTAQTVADHFRHGMTAGRALQPTAGIANSQAWSALAAAAVAPAGAVCARVEVAYTAPGIASTLAFDSFSLRQISPNYGRIRPRRRVKVFATTGQNLMPPGLNLGYETYDGIPAGVDANETGAWVLAPYTNWIRVNGDMSYAPLNSVATLPLYGPSGNGLSVPWMLLPGHSYTFTCQVRGAKFSANHASSTCAVNTTVTSDPSAAVYFNGATNAVQLTSGWQTLTYTFTIPTTYTQPEFLFTLYTTETLTSGSSYNWITSIRNLQLIDVTGGQPVPAYQSGDGTVPVFSGYVDKWENTVSYDEVAEVLVSCSDLFRILGESPLTYAPQSLGFAPTWNCLASWSLEGGGDNWSFNATATAPNIVLSRLTQNGNTAMAGVAYSTTSGVTGSPGQPTMPGVFLGTGNSGISVSRALSTYLLSFGKLPAQGSVEFWFQPRKTDGTYGMNAGDHYLCAFGPLVSLYTSVDTTTNTTSTGYRQISCGWNKRNAFSPQETPLGAADISLGGHIGIECQTTGGTSPTVSVTVYYNGALVAQSSGEPFTAATAGPNGYEFSISGGSSITPPGDGALPPFIGDIYAPAFYGATGLNWAGRLNQFDSHIKGAYQPASPDYKAHDHIASIVTACGVAAIPVVGSDPTSIDSQVDAPGFTSGTGLDAIRQQAAQTGGLVMMSRYGPVMLQNRSYRQAGAQLYSFSATGATAPDDALLFLTDIDRTWTVLEWSHSSSPPATLRHFPGIREYSSQALPLSSSDRQGSEVYVGSANQFAAYLTPTARCDSVRFTIINNALASSVLMADVGSNVVFTDLPDNCPASSYYAWVESVRISAKADGGTLVPEVTFSLSPDPTYVPFI